jgi:hypothetical protein
MGMDREFERDSAGIVYSPEALSEGNVVAVARDHVDAGLRSR